MILLRARFEDFEAFKAALRTLKESHAQRYEAFGPVNLKDIEDLMPDKGTLVRHWATTGAVIGLSTFWLMCIITSLIYGLILGGKPPISNVPYVIPAYEGTILLGSIFAFCAGLWYARLGPREAPPEYDVRYSEDSFGIEVECENGQRESFEALLRDAGAEEVEAI